MGWGVGAAYLQGRCKNPFGMRGSQTWSFPGASLGPLSLPSALELERGTRMVGTHFHPSAPAQEGKNFPSLIHGSLGHKWFQLICFVFLCVHGSLRKQNQEGCWYCYGDFFF